MTDIEQIPIENKVNTPDSGTYGEGAELDRLKQSLPSTQGPSPVGPAQGAGGGTPPMRAPGTGAPPPAPPGIPESILHPGSGFQEGPSQLAGPSPAMQLTGAQRRLQVLDALAESPDVSEETREWAKAVRRVLIGA